MLQGMFEKLGWGRYPVEYDPKIHNIYDPARYYGKPDTAFGEVKLGELGSWFGRRNKNPRAMAQATSRAWWRWQHKYIQCKKGGIAPFYHLVFGLMIFGYIINYPKIRHHARYRFH